MPRFLVAIFHPTDGITPEAASPEAHREIDALNEEMVAAGIRLFVGGLRPPAEAQWIQRQDGSPTTGSGPWLKSPDQIGGFWVLECADMAEALEWGEKASLACRTPVEVRPFF